MIGQLPHEGSRPQTVRNTKELRGRMIHLLPVVDALDDALYALERRTPELVDKFAPLLTATTEWLGHKDADLDRWQVLKDQLEALQPAPEALDDRTAAVCNTPSSAKARTAGARCIGTGGWGGCPRFWIAA
jgi:hypothetical protein